jgi:hypothetical protein
VHRSILSLLLGQCLLLLRSRGSRFRAAAFLSHSQTEGVSARSLVQDSGARSWARPVRFSLRLSL